MKHLWLESVLLGVILLVAAVFNYAQTNNFQKDTNPAVTKQVSIASPLKSSCGTDICNQKSSSFGSTKLDNKIAINPLIEAAPKEEKRIEIDLTNQRLYAYEGDRQIYNFLISSGKWGRTPTGTFYIWVKLRASRMSGGSQALGTYYDLPNVPYVMYFYNGTYPKVQGFSIHGTYWHNNFGHPMSHGCINMQTDQAALIYQWAAPNLNGKASIYASADNPGTKVVIYGQAPTE